MRQLKITKQVTNRETASLDKYLQEIGKVDLIKEINSKFGAANFSYSPNGKLDISGFGIYSGNKIELQENKYFLQPLPLLCNFVPFHYDNEK